MQKHDCTLQRSGERRFGKYSARFVIEPLGGICCDTEHRRPEDAQKPLGCSLAARWIGLPVLQAQYLMLATASVSVLAYNPNHPDVRVIAHWNHAVTGPLG